MFPNKKKDISLLQESESLQKLSGKQDNDEDQRSKRLDNHNTLVNIGLKVVLSVFISTLIWQWFSFMRDTVDFYLYHFNVLEKNPPESVIIATITLGATITGLMVIILKGLFGGKES